MLLALLNQNNSLEFIPKSTLQITDISKRISQAWKMLPPDDRMKWDLIAKKDKERFLAEKRDYKGPWQLPIRTEIEVNLIFPNVFLNNRIRRS